MLKFIMKRIFEAVPTMLVLITISFCLMRFAPGNPFSSERALPPEVMANIEAKYHLDWPMWKQFASYMLGDDILGEEGTSRGIIRGDFGPSLQFRGQTVASIMKTTLPISMQLGFLSLLLALLIGIPTGIISALKQNSIADYVSTF